MVSAGLTDLLSKNELSSLTLYHAITLALEKRQIPDRVNNRSDSSVSSDRPGRIPSATSSTPPRIRYR